MAAAASARPPHNPPGNRAELAPFLAGRAGWSVPAWWLVHPQPGCGRAVPVTRARPASEPSTRSGLRLAGALSPAIWLRWVEPGQPPRPVRLDLVFRTERGTPVNPNHASRAFARLAASAGLAAHPHMLRHALASAMTANTEPASIIAAQLRHADGGALAQRVYIHQLPQTAPRLAGLIEGVFGPAARATRSVSAPRRAEGNRREISAARDGLSTADVISASA